MSGMKWFLTAILLAGSAMPPLCATPSIVLTPVLGNLSGRAGEVVGWGFSITNDVNYIEFNSAQFCVNPIGLPACTLPSTGLFTDIIAGFNDIIVGPTGGTVPTTVAQVFDAVANTGVGSFQFSLGALPGQSDIGMLVLSYTITDLDPNDPLASNLGKGVLLANASVSVVPEPASHFF